MAKAKKKRKERAERLHREPIVRRVAEILEDGTPTRWRWFSDARHGLRAGYCMKGMAWDAAEKRAEAILTHARHRIGLLYPSVSVAAGAAPEERKFFFCATCGGFIREGSPSPWCGEECRNAMRMRERLAWGLDDDLARERARRIILTGGGEPVRWARSQRACRHCGAPFTPGPTQKHQRYCTVACSRRAARHPARDCMICATPFAPTQQGKIYCSPACVRVAEARQKRARWKPAARLVVACRICERPFETADPAHVLCGAPACRAENKRRNMVAFHAKRRERAAEALALAAD